MFQAMYTALEQIDVGAFSHALLSLGSCLLVIGAV